MTLIELMATVAVIGIVATLAVPRFQNTYDRMEYRSASRDMVSTINYARSLAVSDKAQYGVHFAWYPNVVTIFKDSINPSAGTFDANDPVIRCDTLSEMIEYVDMDVSNRIIVFMPNGSAEFSGGGNIFSHGYLAGEMMQYCIHVVPATGKARSYDSWEEWAQNHDPGYEQY